MNTQTKIIEPDEMETCIVCGEPLPDGGQYGMCDDCLEESKNPLP